MAHVPLHHSVLESNGYIAANRPEIIHAVGLIGSQVVSAIHAKPQLFPNPISHPGAELHLGAMFTVSMVLCPLYPPVQLLDPARSP